MSGEELGQLMSEGLINGILQGILIFLKEPMFWVIIAILIVGKILLNKRNRK